MTTRYAVLIYGDEAREESPAERQAAIEAYDAYTRMLNDSGKNNGGEALHPTSTATTVRVREGQTQTTDGPFMESKEVLGGFYLISAEDIDEAITLAAQCPGAATGAVELRPLVEWAADGSPVSADASDRATASV